MNPQLVQTGYGVSAQCPNCNAITSFEPKHTVPILGKYYHSGTNYSRLVNVFSQCARCGRGGLAIVLDLGTNTVGVLESFFPFSIDTAPLPGAVPADIQAEFREAERCASFGANRAAPALLRQVTQTSAIYRSVLTRRRATVSLLPPVKRKLTTTSAHLEMTYCTMTGAK